QGRVVRTGRDVARTVQSRLRLREVADREDVEVAGVELVAGAVEHDEVADVERREGHRVCVGLRSEAYGERASRGHEKQAVQDGLAQVSHAYIVRVAGPQPDDRPLDAVLSFPQARPPMSKKQANFGEPIESIAYGRRIGDVAHRVNTGLQPT